MVCGLLASFAFGEVRAQSYFDDSDYYGLPWVKNVSRPNKIDNGLEGRHLAIWASHGRYYSPAQAIWKWQRVNLFGTNEDLFSQTFVVPYLIPMLENAGAVVWTPRERDWQRIETVVDNDQTLPGYKEQGKWNVSSEAGFGLKKDIIIEGDAPFTMGTAKWSKVRKRKASSVAKYFPYLQTPGRYAVYVSYQTLQNSISDAHYVVVHKGVETHFSVNQTMGGGTWVYLGTFDFGSGDGNYVAVDNVSKMKGVVTTDAVRFGGGMGNTERGGSVSGLPRCLEGARYTAQWSGAPYNVYSSRQGTDDYADDINVRPMMTNWIAGGSMYVPDKEGKGVPLEMSLAVHSDAGYHMDRTLVGTLGICTTDFNDCRLSGGESRMVSYDFVDMMLSQINRDLTYKYGRWHTRGIWDKNYAETRIPGIPSAILEMFSHENISDMLYDYSLHYPDYKEHAVRVSAYDESAGKMFSQSLDESAWMADAARAFVTVRRLIPKNQQQSIQTRLFAPAAELIRRKQKTNNWQTWHNCALACLGVALEDDNLIEAALKTPTYGFNDILDRNLLPDGWWGEGSVSYHFYPLRAMMLTAEAVRCRGINLYDTRIYSMFAAPVRGTYSNLDYVAHNDGWYGSSLTSFARYYGYARF